MLDPKPTSPDLLYAIERAIEADAKASPEERAARRRAQRRSWILAELSFGSDADEAAYRAALAAGDATALARLESEAADRRRRATEILDELGI